MVYFKAMRPGESFLATLLVRTFLFLPSSDAKDLGEKALFPPSDLHLPWEFSPAWHKSGEAEAGLGQDHCLRLLVCQPWLSKGNSIWKRPLCFLWLLAWFPEWVQPSSTHCSSRKQAISGVCFSFPVGNSNSNRIWGDTLQEWPRPGQLPILLNLYTFVLLSSASSRSLWAQETPECIAFRVKSAARELQCCPKGLWPFLEHPTWFIWSPCEPENLVGADLTQSLIWPISAAHAFQLVSVNTRLAVLTKSERQIWVQRHHRGLLPVCPFLPEHRIQHLRPFSETQMATKVSWVVMTRVGSRQRGHSLLWSLQADWFFQGGSSGTKSDGLMPPGRADFPAHQPAGFKMLFSLCDFFKYLLFMCLYSSAAIICHSCIFYSYFVL